MADTWSWWLVSNRHGGMSRTLAPSAVEARRNVREGIAEAFLSEGCTEAQARRGASSYGVWVVAGGCTQQEADEAAAAWNDLDHTDAAPAQELHDRWRDSLGLPRLDIMRRPAR